MQDREIIDRCFSGTDPRDCESCPIHKENGGDCCIGTYESDNSTCLSCIHEATCIKQTGALERAQRTPQRSIRLPVVRNPVRKPIAAPEIRRVGSRQEEPGRLLAPTDDYGYSPIDVGEDATMLQKVGWRAGWGAMEGAVEMLGDFFRTRRPR